MVYMFEGCPLPDWCRLQSTGKENYETLEIEED